MNANVHLAPNRISWLLCALGVLFFASIHSQALTDKTLASLTLEQKLNVQVPPDLMFTDETGKPVHLGDFLGAKPVILVLGYYECPMLCTMVLNGMVESLEDIKWSVGREFTIINVSINPRETAALAAAKKRTYLKRYGRAGAAEGWHFLTGQEPAIRRLADQVGFQYAYDEVSKQYAHPSGLIILTREGKVAAYLFGVTYAPGELFSALSSASSNKTTSPIKKFILLCFHYNPISGKYGARIMLMVRGLSLITVLALMWLFIAGALRSRAERGPGNQLEPQNDFQPTVSDAGARLNRKEAR